MKAILLVSHGSRSPKLKEEVSVLVEALRKQLPGSLVEFAFLEIEKPSIPEGINQCVSQGAKEVVIALNFLNAGRHVNDDIPVLVQAAQKKYHGVKFSMTKPVGQHPQIPDLFIDLIDETA